MFNSPVNVQPVNSFNGPPCEGAFNVTHTLQFSVDQIQILDLSAAQNVGRFSAFETMYIDNSLNTQPIFVVMDVTYQSMTIPALACAYLPILQPNPPKIQFMSTGGIDIKINCLNFFLPPFVWSPSLPPGGGSGGGGAANISGTQPSGALLTSNPVTVGAMANSINPVKVANGQVVNLMADLHGKLIGIDAPRELLNSRHTTLNATIAETTIIPAQPGFFADVFTLIIANTNTVATDVNVTIRDVLAGAIVDVFAIKQGTTAGFTRNAGSARRQTTAASAWTAQCSAAVNAIEITAEWVNNT